MSHLPPKGGAIDLTLGLRERRELLAECLVKLIVFAHSEGFTVTIEEVKRSKAQAAANAAAGTGIKNSLHLDGLAVDLNLYKDGKWLSKTEDHSLLGAYWKALHPLCRWGGDFNDGNHYSVTWQGRK